MFTCEILESQIPTQFDEFSKEIGEENWQKRVKKCKEETKGNPLLKEYLYRENYIAFQLNELSEQKKKFGKIKYNEDSKSKFYPTIVFIDRALAIIKNGNKENAERFRRRIHGAFKNPADMRGLQLELLVATHFAKLKKEISWPETEAEGNERFDLLIGGNGDAKLEVECKSIGDDTGRKITQREVIDFAWLLKKYLNNHLNKLATGLSVVLTVPDKFPRNHTEQLKFAKKIKLAILSGGKLHKSDDLDIKISDFDVKKFDSCNISQEDARHIIDDISGTKNRSSALMKTEADGLFVLTIQSLCDNTLLRAVFNTLSDAAKRQLTTSRAGMLIVGFDGIDSEQLCLIVKQDEDARQRPTDLRLEASKFLLAHDRKHVIGVAFVSNGRRKGVVSTTNLTYYFPNHESIFWSKEFDNLF
ncbi:hypothetical protein LH425_06720 [Laribacter hongkongensis]|uniref:hypothetical protein n=1 Tax=Laribacter hongkongensis TaxID=168471 RepID=UPI001EFD56D0|nr:hypothetical protein [Laribacter hongkongensis]MCG9064735.1 hypothetical protein [Laribacter hongkongensis]